MSLAPLDSAARAVLQHYPPSPRPRTITPLGNRGGFSGARIWRIACELGDVCLRAWPVGVAEETLAFQHDLIRRARQAGLTFVPSVHVSNQGTTWVSHAGRLWEASSWQAGRADFEANPSPERLRSACIALARLHDAWMVAPNREERCPAVLRRLARASEWMALVASGWREPLNGGIGDPPRPLVEQAWPMLVREVARVPRLLAGWTERTVRVQPCLCDVWHDHLLFEGDTLTGLIDYGSVKIDNVGVDLARLLGSLVGDDAERWRVGLSAYRGIRPLSAAEEGMARVLDETGTILGVVNWLLWIYRDRRPYDDWSGVAQRLRRLIARMERWMATQDE